MAVQAMPALLTQAEVALRLSVSIETVRRLGAEGDLRRVLVRGQWRIEPRELEAYLDRNREGEAA